MKLAVLAFSLSLSLSLSVPALADTVTTEIYGTLANGSVASGTLTVDPTAGTAGGEFVTGADITIGTETFNTLLAYQGTYDGEYYFDVYTPVSTDKDYLQLGFLLSETATLSNGNPDFCVAGDGCVYTSALIQPGVGMPQFETLGAAPEPSSLVLLGTGILGLAGAARRRFVRT